MPKLKLVPTMVAGVGSLILAAGAHAKLVTEEISYDVNGAPYTGYFAWDDEIEGKRPGVIVVHEWWGHNSFARSQAEKLAKAGYTAFALDMYGKGKIADHPKEAQAFMAAATEKSSQIKDRFEKGMELLKQHKTVNPDHIAAQGYCFGGAVVLNMARMGADLAGVVSYHGALGGLVEPQTETIKPRVMVFTGGEDQMVPASQVSDFVASMMPLNTDLNLVVYPEAMHSFTNPDATAMGEKYGIPIAYNEEAANRSWESTLTFYRSIFGE